MRLGKRAILWCGTATLLAGIATGCGNFWQAPSTTTTCTTNCTTASSGNFYILNGGTTPQVVGESIVTGTLTAISGSPWALQATPYAMAIDPAGNFLIVSTTSGVFAYPIDNGVLGTAVVVSSDQAYAVQVDTTSSWLIEAIPGTSGVTIGAIPINSTTGASNGTEQTASFNVANTSVQNKMAISGDDSYVFVPLGAGGTIVVPFNASVTAGSNPLGSKATTIPVASASGSALSVAVDTGTSPRVFYVGETLAGTSGTTGGLRVFNYSSLTSTLTQATGSPIASGGAGAECDSTRCFRQLRLCGQWARHSIGRKCDRIYLYFERDDDHHVHGGAGHDHRRGSAAGKPDRGYDQHLRDCGWGGG